MVTPLEQLNAAREGLVRFFLVIVLTGIELSVLFSAILSRRTARNVRSVVEALNRTSADLPEARLKPVDDIYGYIVEEVEKSGLYRQMMEMQVSHKRYELQLHEARELQYQINPHFQINTLRTIYWKIVEKEGMGSDAAAMVENMLDFTGYVLADPHGLVRFEEEVEHTKSFCEILETRHQGDVDVVWDIDESCLSALCCRLILQPYIENAYYHGLRGLKSHRNIDIRARVKDGRVVVSIRDDGRGMTPERLSEVRACLKAEGTQTAFTGIYNPHRRIVLTFGEQYGVRIDAEEGRGTEVTLTFPYMMQARGEMDSV